MPSAVPAPNAPPAAPALCAPPEPEPNGNSDDEWRVSNYEEEGGPGVDVDMSDAAAGRLPFDVLLTTYTLFQRDGEAQT